MRVVVDMQGAQTGSRFRGIGRYTISFVKAIVRNRGDHEVILALSGLFPEAIEPIRSEFDGLLPQENIRVWHAVGPVQECDPSNELRRETAELMREAFLASLRPDVIHITSLFEGFGDDAVGSVARLDKVTPITVSFYDLIPLLNASQYIDPNPQFGAYYYRKIEYAKKAYACFAISDFSRREGVEYMQFPADRMINVSTAIEPHFQKIEIDEQDINRLRRKFSIVNEFILYAGGADDRKNLIRLISAYASLPESLRLQYQLVFAGKMPEEVVAHLKQHAENENLHPEDICFTGYITDNELVQLYNLCSCFVFPSWHEGFGLPALEAMSCGAPVIASNTSSLPEVVGLPDALFDPFDTQAISGKLIQVLEDVDFREKLRKHGMTRSQQYSWDESARIAISTWESIEPRHLAHGDSQLALFRNLQSSLFDAGPEFLSDVAGFLAKNQQSGIERQLLVDVSELSQKDSATGVQRVVRSYLYWLLKHPPADFRVEPVYGSISDGYRYARNYVQKLEGGDGGQLIDERVRWQRGDIFFGLDMQHHVQLANAEFFQQLRIDGVTVKFLVYDLLPIQFPDYFADSNSKALHEALLSMMAASDGVICISKATSDAFDTWLCKRSEEKPENFQNTWVHIGADVDGSKPSFGLPDNADQVLATIKKSPTFLCVSTIEPRKCQEEVLNALQSLWNEGQDVNLVFVGQQGWKVEALAKRILSHPELGRRLFWLRGISDEYLEKVYSASTCLVAASINEGFGLPIIEAARFDLPVVARDIPVFREVAGEGAFYFGGEEFPVLSEALKYWLAQYEEGALPKSSNLRFSTWEECTEKLKVALLREAIPRNQILLDISTLVESDAKTGIQRVVRSILRQWLAHPPKGYSVEPVYATLDHSYRYARKFTQRFLGKFDFEASDELIEYSPGDIFIALDLNLHVPVAHQQSLNAMKREGVNVYFIIYDLLPIKFPHFWEPQNSLSVDFLVARWLNLVSDFSGAFCISRAVANELSEWRSENVRNLDRPFTIDWFHLGADVNESVPSKGLPGNSTMMLDCFRSRPSFLLVGTIEPRKAHDQVLAAFEKLWQSGVDVNLVIVGKQGWMVEELVGRIQSHSELQNRLFWLDGISDEYLELVYDACSCLIAASYGEGFGLPLIEAAQRELPIIARDIPVFREVAGANAYYFNGMDPESLAHDISEWIESYKIQSHPEIKGMEWLTWRQSAQCLLEKVIND